MESRNESIDFNKCWWCGNSANSREHIIKRSDIKRSFGLPPYSLKNQPIVRKGFGLEKVQGPKSNLVKFKANLCQECNNSRSSEFDKSYDKFISQIQPYFEEILKTGEINLKAVLGEHWRIEFKNFLKYYLKHIGCRLSNENIPIPENLVNCLNDLEELRHVKLHLEIRALNQPFKEAAINEDIKTFDILYVGEIIRIYNTKNHLKDADSYISWLTTGWLSVNYIIESDVNSGHLDCRTIDSIISVDIAAKETPKSFLALPNISEKLRCLEEHDRVGSQELLRSFYTRVKN